MNDPASIRPSGHRSHEVEAVETIGGVMTDLMDVTERLPVRPDQAEATARILDRLSEELGEAAGMLRAAHALPGTGKIELPRLRIAAVSASAMVIRPSENSGYLSLVDDSQRMIVWCALHDACEWHYRATSNCRGCQEFGTCAGHWREHQEPADTYREIMMRLGSYEGSARGIACALDSADRQAIATALPLAIAYRDNQDAAEDSALVAAYRHLSCAEAGR